MPLVLMFHGGAGSPQVFAEGTGMHRIAEQEGFIVAYPAGTPGRSGLTWSPGVNRQRDVDDVGFVHALVAELCRRYPIDPDRIYAAGLSIGGTLVYELACALSDELAAVAVVAGVMTSLDCDPKRSVPLIHIHGTSDQRVPLHGGRADSRPRTTNGRRCRTASTSGATSTSAAKTLASFASSTV